MIKTIIFRTSVFLWFFICSPILLIGLVSKKLSSFLMIRVGYGLVAAARIFGGIKLNVHGTIAPNTIIASKHMSILEVAALITMCKDPFFILKQELVRIPIYGWAFKRMGFIGVNRKPGATNMRVLAQMAKDRINRGQTLIIFPEGTRAKPGQKIELKGGLILIARLTQTNIQTAGTDSGLYWPKKGRINSGTANLWCEEVLPYNASIDEIAESIQRHSA